VEPVRHHRSQVVIDASRLHRVRERRELGQTLIEGPHLLQEAVNAGADVRTVFTLVDDAVGQDAVRSIGLEPVVVDERALRRLAGTETPRGPIAVVGIPAEDRPESSNLLVSWGVSDPGNVGTMIRVAAAFDWGFGYTEGTADPWSPKVLRAGAGTQFSVRITKLTGIDDVRSSGHSPVATVVGGGEPPESLGEGRWAVLIGEEASGLPPDVVDSCEREITIAMPGGTESLNAGVAAGILTYALSKHSGEPGERV
jgi:TrmH family RNA methyltransferase